MMQPGKGWIYPPAPHSFPEGAEVFIHNDRGTHAPSDRYCGAWVKDKRAQQLHKFMIPGSIRKDGFYSDPIEARDALEKHLKEVER